jgi:pentapeptide MXKDX repeat protein
MLKVSMLVAASLLLAAPAFADDMIKMDANHDGTVSREEYMNYHEAQWDKMKKNKSGGVDVGGAMKHDAMKGDAMKGDAMKGDAMKGDAMKGDSMKGDAMKGDSMMKK